MIIVDILTILILQYIVLIDSLHYARTFHLLEFLAETFRSMCIIFNA